MKLMPDELQVIFGLATILEIAGTDDAGDEVDAVYLRFIDRHRNLPMDADAEKAHAAFGKSA